MKVKKCKNTLLCGTLTLCLWGGFSQVRAASFENFAIEQQSNKVTGIVNDEFGPVIGASVVEKGTSNGVVTDLDGKFSLNVKPGATLIISFVGYKQQEVKAGNAPLNIVLEEDSKMLSEVVVTALGIKRERKALGYGVAEVQGEALTKAKETNVINSMAGRVPGLVVTQTAGGASGSSRVILRGSTEMTGNNQPLYVIDGVPLDNTNFGSAGTYGGFDLGDGISSVNPDDIESMSVLKGPAASALYGSRASHGVILITTKKANKDKVSVEYNGTLTFDTQLAKWDDVQQVYGMGANGTYPINAVSNTNMSWGAKADGTNMLKYFDGVERPYLIVPDNTSQFFRTGFTATNSAIIGVNNGKTGIRFTYTDMRNKDIVPKTHMSRDIFNLRANTSAGKFDLDFSVNYTREDVKNRPALGDSKSNIGKNLMTLATTYDQAWLKSYQDANGEYANWNGMDPYNVNPYWDVYKNSNSSKKDQFRFNGKVVWNITQHLKVQGTAGAELNWFTFEDYKAPTTPGYESVLKGYRLLPVPENPKLRDSLADKSLAELTRLLSTYRKLHNSTDVDTVKRAIRAIEIEEYYKHQSAEYREFPQIHSLIIGVDIARELRREKISHRLKQRLDEGMVNEVKALLDSGISSEDLIYYGLEYKYLTLYVLGKLSFNEMFHQLEIAIHQFAKRQMTWFRGMERRGFTIHWLDACLPMEDKVEKIINLLHTKN